MRDADSNPDVTWYGNDRDDGNVGWDDERVGVSDLGCACCLTSLELVLELVKDCSSWEFLRAWDLRL